MKYITNKKIEDLTYLESQMISWIDQALRIKTNAQLPPKISMVEEGGIFYNTMPCLIKEENVAGVKVVSRYPKRNTTIQGEILLYNFEDGDLMALLDAEYITKMRTGAVAAHSILLLEKSNAKIYSWLGLGQTAKATVKLFLKSCRKQDLIFKVFKYKNQHNEFVDFVDAIKGDINVVYEFTETYEELMTNTDVIISAVSYAPVDFVKFDILPEGVLVVPIHTRGFVEIDYNFDKIFADDTDHVRHFKHFNKYKYFCETSDVLIDNSKGRASDDEKIIVYNIGISLHDIYFSKQIYDELNNEL